MKMTKEEISAVDKMDLELYRIRCAAMDFYEKTGSLDWLTLHDLVSDARRQSNCMLPEKIRK